MKTDINPKTSNPVEQNITSGSSKWSLAGKDGLMLAAISVVVMTLSLLTKSTFLGFLLWAVKLGGSIWLLNVIMKRYGKDHPGESTFGYGFAVCALSALVCAIWTFFLYSVLFPGAVAEVFEQYYATLAQMGDMFPADQSGMMTDMMLKMEDNFAQISCISTFFWAALLGLIFSAILSHGGKASGNPFTPEEMGRDNDGFNF